MLLWLIIFAVVLLLISVILFAGLSKFRPGAGYNGQYYMNGKYYSRAHAGGADHSGIWPRLGRGGMPSPLKAVYVGYSNVSNIDGIVREATDAGFNLIVLAFYMGPETGTDPYSAAWYWQQLSTDQRKAAMKYANERGARVIVSAGGAGYTSYPANGAAAFGSGAAQFALLHDLDGVDMDFENFTTAFGTPSGLNKAQTIQWLTDATAAARELLGVERLITHAPQSPYWNVEFAYGYLDWWLSGGNELTTAILMQYYNQGSGAYPTYESQFVSNNFHPGTAVAQLISAGVAGNKIVVGKLTQPGDGDPATWIDPATLGTWFQQAATDTRTGNWATGVSTWQWHASGSPTSLQFLSAVYP
jgi:hypothetical protein